MDQWMEWEEELTILDDKKQKYEESWISVIAW